MNVTEENAELPFDKQSHPLERAQRHAKSVYGCSRDQGRLQTRLLPGPAPSAAPTLAHRAQRFQSFGFEHPAPAVHGLRRRRAHYTARPACARLAAAAPRAPRSQATSSCYTTANECARHRVIVHRCNSNRTMMVVPD